MHRRAGSLSKELVQAEAEFAQNEDEASYERLVSIRAELSSLEGTQAIIEDFGHASGRNIRSF